MPLSEDRSNSSSAVSTPGLEPLGSMDTSDTGTLYDLKTFNGQKKYPADHTNVDKTIASINNHVHPKAMKCFGGIDGNVLHIDDDDDVMILKDKSKQDNKTTTYNNGTSVPLSKPCSFSINDSMRNSFKDMISKIQTPSLGTLLSKTKYTGLNSRDKPPVLVGATQNAEKKNQSCGNLFENMKEIGIDNGHFQPCSVSDFDKTEIIDLDDSTEDNQQQEEDKGDKDDKEKTSDDKEKSTEDKEKSVQKGNTREGSVHSDRSPCVDSNSGDSVDNDETISQHSSQDVDSSSQDLNSRDSTEKLNSEPFTSEIGQDLEGSHDSLVSVSTSHDSVQLEHSSTSLALSNSSEKQSENSSCDRDKSVQLEQDSRQSKACDDMTHVNSESELLSLESSACDKDSKQYDMELGEEDERKLLSLEEDKQQESLKTIKKELQICPESQAMETVQICPESQAMETEELKAEKKEITSTDKTSSSIKEESEKIQVKIESDEQTSELVKKNESSPQNEILEAENRKRSADVEAASSEPKRSRLDMVIGKLGSQIGISPEAISTEDEDDESATDSATESSSPTSAETEEEEENTTSPKKRRKRSIRLSEKALENVLRTKIRAILHAEQGEQVAELKKKLSELEAVNEELRSAARDSAKQMLDITVLQQKCEKRKAKTAALKKITTRNIGVQVDCKMTAVPAVLPQDILENGPAKLPISRTPPRFPAPQKPSPIVPNTILNARPPNLNLVPPKTALITTNHNKPPILQQATQGTNIPQGLVSPTTGLISKVPVPNVQPNQPNKNILGASPTVKSILEATRQNTTIAKPAVPAGYIMVTSIPSTGIVQTSNKQIVATPPGVTTVTTLVGPQPVKVIDQRVIDLTVDDEGNKNLVTHTIPVQVGGASTTPVQVAGSSAVSQPVMVPAVRHLQPSTQGLQQPGILLSAPAMQQVVQSSPQAYQLVFNSTSPAIRPGGLMTFPATIATSAIHTSSPVSNVTQPIRTSLMLRQTTPMRVTTPSPSVTNAARMPAVISTPTSQTPLRPPPPLQSAPNTNMRTNTSLSSQSSVPRTTTPSQPLTHPAPLPIVKSSTDSIGKPVPPQPTLKISRVSHGIVLSWNMTFDAKKYADIQSYQLFAYQEGSAPPSTTLWKKVGDVKALALPMACTLTQFQEGNKYHFAVRAVDSLKRYGAFSEPGTIHLKAFKS